MPNSIGRIFVELGINSAAFSEGMQKATYQTQQFGKKMSSEFRALGNSLSVMAGAFGAFGPAGAALASAVSIAGQAAGNATERFAKLGKSVGVLTGITAGAVTAFASLAAAGFGLVIKTSADILHEMERQSQSAGVNITQFSRLAYATRVLGLEQETLVKGLQRMNRAALMAAEGSKQQQFAFQMLLGPGQEFQDVMHGGTVNLEALADGFRRIKDPQLQSAMAMMVFGRAGAELVPLLNQGSAGLKKFADEADALGVTLTTADAEAATRLTMNMTRLREAFSGIAIRITNQLSPALSNITDSLVDFAKNGDRVKAMGQALGTVLVSLTKIIFEAGYAWTFWGAKLQEQKAHWDDFFTSIKAGYEYMTSGAISNATKKALDDAAAASASATKDAEDRIKKASADLDKELADLNKPPSETPTHEEAGGKRKGGIAIPSTTPLMDSTDQATKYLKTLEDAAAKAKALASAVNETVGAQAMLNAQSEAADSIANEKAAIQEQIDHYTKLIASNSANYTAQQRAAYQNEIKDLRAELLLLDDNRQKIVQLYATIAGSKEAQDATRSMESETMRYSERIKALKTDLAALASGHPFKTQSADLADDLEKVKELQDALAKAQQLYGQNSDAVKELAHALDTANAALTKHREQLEQIDALQQQENDMKKAQEAAQKAANDRLKQEQELAKKTIGTMMEGFAKAIVTGKENFRELFASIEEGLIKSGMTNILQNLGKGLANIHKPGGFQGGLAPHAPGPMGMIGGILGFGGKGAQPKVVGGAMLVQEVSGLGALGKGGKGVLSGLPGSGKANPLGSSDIGAALGIGKGKSGGAGGILGGLGKMGGGIFGKIFGFASMFAGFLAHGGDVTPGRAYVVGEKHPEFFVPRSPGTVATRLNIEPGSPVQHTVNVNTHIEAMDPSAFEDVIGAHKQAVTDGVMQGLRSRGVI
jgi:hypothetical protein